MAFIPQEKEQESLYGSEPAIAELIAMGYTPEAAIEKFRTLSEAQIEDLEVRLRQERGNLTPPLPGALRNALPSGTPDSSHIPGAPDLISTGFNLPGSPLYGVQQGPISSGTQTGPTGGSVVRGHGSVTVDRSISPSLTNGAYTGNFGAGVGTDTVHTNAVARALTAHAANKPPGWEALVQQVKGQATPQAQLAMANKLITNLLHYQGNHDAGAPWAYTPAEALKVGVSNCREIALAKLLLLHDAGFATKDLALATLPDANGHVVAVVKTDGNQQYIMDLGWRSGTPARVLNVADIGHDPVLSRFPNPTRMTPMPGDAPSPTFMAHADPSPQVQKAKPSPAMV